MTRKFRAAYRKLWEAPGEKCLHEQRRPSRITLVCARPKGHPADVRHLHDVPPEVQIHE